jgi:stage V sporulation protein AC
MSSENREQKKYREYDRLVKRLTPNSNYIQGYVRAFWVGGVICTIGQLISMAGKEWLNMTESSAAMLTSVVLIFIGTTLTGLGIYDDIGRYAGAGSIVPITGFANSVASPAIEFRREGFIMGIGAKLFVISGPVLVYGITSSIAVGIIYWLIGRLGG